jgi:muramoyltetrapeptide carboxypeptidase
MSFLQSLIAPPALQKGDSVMFVAPSRAVAGAHELETARKTFEQWGLQVIYAPHVLAQHFQQAGTDVQRLSDLQNALDNEQIRAIICIRGGYGMSRIIDDLNFEQFAKSPKWLVGFSDITLLINHLNNLGFQAIHGTMPKLFGVEGGTFAEESLRMTLFGEKVNYKIPSNEHNSQGQARGILVGGNLCMLCHSIGSASEIVTENRILFLEEIGEDLYKIDRFFWQLRRSGKLKNLGGLIIGDFSGIPPEIGTPFGVTVAEIVASHTARSNFPVVHNFSVGHCPQNWAMRTGALVSLSVTSEEVILNFDESKTFLA